MTYLTQLVLDFASAAKLGLRDNYNWHQAVWNAFPGRDGERRDFLTLMGTPPPMAVRLEKAVPSRRAWCRTFGAPFGRDLGSRPDGRA